MRLLSALAAATFAVASFTPLSFAAEKDTITDACKGKKAGEEVTVGGEKMKCPAPKK